MFGTLENRSYCSIICEYNLRTERGTLQMREWYMRH